MIILCKLARNMYLAKPMKTNLFRGVFRIAACYVLMLLATCAVGAERKQMIVSVAASLKEAIQEGVKAYALVESGVEIVTTYGSSGSLCKQIEQGAPVDVFISASSNHMDALQKGGLLWDGTRRDLLQNKLVLIVPADGKAISSFAEAATNGVGRLAIGEPSSVPVGQYAAQVFTTLGVLDAAKQKAVYAKDVRQVLTYVERGEVEAGVVYSTDAALSKQVKVVAEAPTDSHDPIVYPGAVLAASGQKEVANAFLEWLSSSAGKAVFKKYGFIVE